MKESIYILLLGITIYISGAFLGYNLRQPYKIEINPTPAYKTIDANKEYTV